MFPGENEPEPDREFGIETLIAEGLQRLETSGEPGLERLCADHPQQAALLRQKIARLREQGLLKKPAVERVGPYRLLRSLGRGGMGEVYLAEQREPVRRLVALKIVRDDIADTSALARFDSERQALAMMDHPGIARVFDAGSTEDGRPYLAMEYVDGLPITDWCDENRLSIADRLRVFAVVCDAVHHAHQNGVIHRDIKPSNILVREFDGHPQPKVIDFGLAKAFGSGLTAITLQTQAGQILGTPAYMSPEQAKGDGHSVDARADVYALGALLYELTCSARPFDERRLQQAGILEVLRILREEEPPSPTRRLQSLQASDVAEAASNRRLASSSALLRVLHGEIDWIVLKAIAKVPRDRFASVSEFAADVRRHLAGHAVLAGPPTAGYRIRKFVRRHRNLVTIGTAMAIAAVTALILILRLGFEARENLKHFDRLASRSAVAGLLREAEDDLWPAKPATIPAMREWLTRARALSDSSQRRMIEDEIEQLRTTGSPREPNEAVLLEGLVALIGDLDRLTGDHGALAGIEARITEADAVRHGTVDEHRAEWDRTIDGVRAELRLELQPIVGLTPLGQDPVTHFYEFAVSTPGGQLPRRDEHGELVLTDTLDDPVLVLLPGGGNVVVGSQSTNPKAPHFDPQRGSDETPAQRCRLEPFMISKFEITQAQWRRVMGSNPSTFAPDQQAGRAVGVNSELHPVESVSWVECVAFCKRLDLELPSESQWEYAARGETDTPWWTGSDPRSLAVAANLADKTRAVRYALSTGCDDWLDDGFAAHAPVGSFERNGFGLYDVIGNVWEWSRSAATSWPPTQEDGRRVQSYCGGSFASTAARARTTCVLAEPGMNRKHVIGLRPGLVPNR